MTTMPIDVVLPVGGVAVEAFPSDVDIQVLLNCC
jgi:hypothetical protein